MTESQGVNITLRTLAVINEERNIHGLRYSDYARYRKHCANKTHRLRQVLKLTYGNNKAFKKPPEVPNENLKDGHLLLDLFEAERAWSYAQELLAEHTKSKDGTVRRRALSRFKRAIDWAEQLHNRAKTLYDPSSPSSRLSAVSYAEIATYNLMLRGRFLRTKDEYEPALVDLAISRSILDQLSESAASSHDQALYAVFIDEVGPEIRFCAHQMGRAKAYDIDAIAADIAPKHGDRELTGYTALLKSLKSSALTGYARDLQPIVWEGRPVAIRSPELVDAFIRIQQAVKSLESKRKVVHTTEAGQAPAKASRGQLAAFDGVLSALSDAEAMSKKLAESQTATGRAAAGSDNRDPRFIHDFISYQLISFRIQRDLLIANTLIQRPSSTEKIGTPFQKKQPVADATVYPAVTKALDTVLQSLRQMRELSITDESPDVATALDARVSYTSARRCGYLSLCHAAVKNYAESVALNSNAQLRLREARATVESAPDTPPEVAFYPLSTACLDSLENELGDQALRVKKEWYTFNGGAVGNHADAKHKKPLFFDIAFNYIESPVDRINRRAGKVVSEPPQTHPATGKASASPVMSKGKVDRAEVDQEEPPAPAPSAPAHSGLSSLLGSWWGRR